MMQGDDLGQSRWVFDGDEANGQVKTRRAGEPILCHDEASPSVHRLFENRFRVYLRLLGYRLRHPLEMLFEFLATTAPSWLFLYISEVLHPAAARSRIADDVEKGPDVDSGNADMKRPGIPVVLLLASVESGSDRRRTTMIVKELAAAGWRVIRPVLVPSRAGGIELNIDPVSQEETLRVSVGRKWVSDGGRLQRRELGIIARAITSLGNRQNLNFGVIVCTSDFWLDLARIVRAVMEWPLVALPYAVDAAAKQSSGVLERWSNLALSVGSEMTIGVVNERLPQSESSSPRGPKLGLGEVLKELFPRVSIAILSDDKDGFLRQQLHRRTWYPNFEIMTCEDDPGDVEQPLWLRRIHKATETASGEVICFVQGPATVGSGWLCGLMHQLQADPLVGLVTPASNTGVPGIRVHGTYTNASQFKRWVTKFALAQRKKAISVPFAPLTCCLVRRDLLRKVGGFDQGLDDQFLSELDFARRVRQAGYDVQCVHTAYVHVSPAEIRPGEVERRVNLNQREQARSRYRENRRRKEGEGKNDWEVVEQTVYDSADRPPAMVAELQELVRYRDLVLLLTSSNIRTRYKRSILGVGWTVLNPLLHMTVLTLAFAAVFKSSVVDYPVYVLSGLIVWNFFTQTTAASMTAMISGGTLMRQIYIPPSVFCVATVTAGLVNLFVSLIPLVLIMVIMGHPLRLAALFVPLSVIMLSMFSLGVALILGTLAVFFTDLVELYGVILRAGYFLTAVMYPITIVPERWRWIIEINPVYSYVRCFRVPIYSGVFPPWQAIAIAAGSGILFLGIGWWVLARKAYEIVYRT